VSPIRAWFDYYSRPFLALAESLLTADDAAVEAVNAPPAAVLHDETAAQIAEVLDGEGGLDFAATTLRAPEVDGNVSENTLASYARSIAGSGGGGGGGRMFSAGALARGYEYVRPTLDDKVFAAHKRRLRAITQMPTTETEAAAIKELAAEFNLTVETLIHSAAIRDALHQAEVNQLKAELRAERLAASLHSPEEEQLFLESLEPFARSLGTSVDEMLSASIPPKRRTP
jgi:hypothetical protein